MPDQSSRWYPTKTQLADPAALERSFRQLLNRYYALQDAHAALKSKVDSAGAPASTPFPAGSGPIDSALVGLRVDPIDTSALADGTVLTFVKKTGTLKFK